MTKTAKPPALNGQMSLVEHLGELRKRIVISLVAVVLGAIVVSIFYQPTLDFLRQPYCGIEGVLSSEALVDAASDVEGEELVQDGSVSEEGCDAVFLLANPLEGLSVRLLITLYGGLALAAPVILWQIWKFIVPGLYPNEKRYGIVFVALSTLLFACGCSLAYWSVPRALDFLVTIGGEGFVNLYGPKAYFNFLVKMVIGFGIGFQFPIVLIFLQMLDLVQTQTLREGRRYAIVGIVILVAVLTPSGDPGTLLALSIPMYLFYEMSIIFGRLRQRRIRKAAAAS